ncbi:MAG: gliding motility-associated C-terminal domain-containing protein, partial [Chitinophagaceae bacterium]|nr:gliding motility-associated C-terminal domain-containing protein [Chitinophagaceae bacterium]
GGVPYTFTNVAAGLHNYQVFDVVGCASTIYPVMVDPGPQLVTTANRTHVLCNGDATGTITVNPPPLAIPPFDYSLDGSNWQSSAFFSGLTAGNYTVYFRSVNGCQGTLPVTINQPAPLSTTSSIAPVSCNGENDGVITVTTTGGTSPYQYSINGGGTWQTSNMFTVPAGNYTITIRDINNCITTRNVTMTQPAVLTAFSANTNATCDGGDNGRITVNATGGNANYRYSLDGFTFQSLNYFNVAPGTYTVTVKDDKGCSTVFTTIVGLTFNLSLPAQADLDMCEGRSIQMQTVSNATQYTWSPASGLSNVNIANPVASPAVTSEYILTAVLGRCTAYDTVIVNVHTAPIPNAGPDGDICYGQSYTLQGTGGAQYTWTPQLYLNTNTGANPVSTPTKTTVYTLSVADAIGCQSIVTDEVKVVVKRVMKVNTFPFDTIAHPGDQVQLLATSPGISYTWSPPVRLSSTTIPNPVVTVGDIGENMQYEVVAVDEEGCKAEGYVRIRVYKGPEIYVPTGFTPNGDGLNDVFVPVPVGISSYNYFRVYNRWGQLVFSTNRMNAGWDGKLGGREQPPGTYVWMVEGITEDKRVITKKGTILLIR